MEIMNTVPRNDQQRIQHRGRPVRGCYTLTGTGNTSRQPLHLEAAVLIRWLSVYETGIIHSESRIYGFCAPRQTSELKKLERGDVPEL